MSVTYYTFNKDEFASIKEVVKGQMQRIWANDLARANENLDDQDVFLKYFEGYQHLIGVDTLSRELKEASISLQMDKEKIAAFIYKVRNGKYHYEIKKAQQRNGYNVLGMK